MNEINVDFNATISVEVQVLSVGDDAFQPDIQWVVDETFSDSSLHSNLQDAYKYVNSSDFKHGGFCLVLNLPECDFVFAHTINPVLNLTGDVIHIVDEDTDEIVKTYHPIHQRSYIMERGGDTKLFGLPDAPRSPFVFLVSDDVHRVAVESGGWERTYRVNRPINTFIGDDDLIHVEARNITREIS